MARTQRDTMHMRSTKSERTSERARVRLHFRIPNRIKWTKKKLVVYIHISRSIVSHADSFCTDHRTRTRTGESNMWQRTINFEFRLLTFQRCQLHFRHLCSNTQMHTHTERRTFCSTKCEWMCVWAVIAAAALGFKNVFLARSECAFSFLRCDIFRCSFRSSRITQNFSTQQRSWNKKKARDSSNLIERQCAIDTYINISADSLVTASVIQFLFCFMLDKIHRRQ